MKGLDDNIGTALDTAINSGYVFTQPQVSDYVKRIDSLRMAIDATHRTKGTSIGIVLDAAEQIYNFLNKNQQ